MSLGILVTVRSASHRLAKKCLLPFPENPVIAHVMNRAKQIGLPIVLCTTKDTSDDELCEWAKDTSLLIHRGHTVNKINRWYEASTHYRFSHVHVLDADDPFFDYNEVQDSISWLVQDELSMIRTSKQSDAGMASVGTSMSQQFLRILNERTDGLNSNDLDVVPWNLLLSKRDSVLTMPDRDLGLLKGTVRLTLDYPEDYEFLVELARALGPEASRFAVEHYISQHLHLTEINSARTADFLDRQLRQRENFLEGGRVQ